ncbi:MAG: carboxylesterase family protein, partial [Propionibacterium sp.]|nr:carboxylesterase family protein [Propionibacterium sp.]
MLLAIIVVSSGVILHSLRRRKALLKVGVWLASTALVCTTAVVAYPPASTRTAGGDHPIPSRTVQTTEGSVRGVVNDARTVEIFAGIPYAQPPVGDLRWHAPKPPRPHVDILVADRFSAVPV